MSRRWVSGALLAVALATTKSARVEAQTIQQQERRLDSLKAMAVRAQSTLRAYDDSVALEDRRLDTVTVGAITVLTERPLVPFAREVARIALDSVTRKLGPVMARLTSYTFVIRTSEPDQWERRPGKTDHLLHVAYRNRAGREMFSARLEQNAALVAPVLRHNVLVEFVAEADPGFFAWMGRGIPIDSVTTADWMQYRLLLISTPAVIGQRCYKGDLRACAVALQLTPASDPATEWFDAPGRRRIVEQGRALARRISGRATNSCLAGSDSACISLLRRFSPSDLPEPVPPGARLSLAQLAKTMGGAGGLDRLLAGQRQPAERITAAAQAPVDTVLARWQRNVRQARAPSRDLSYGIVSLSVLWTLGLAAVSTRSSRWR